MKRNAVGERDRFPILSNGLHVKKRAIRSALVQLTPENMGFRDDLDGPVSVNRILRPQKRHGDCLHALDERKQNLSV